MSFLLYESSSRNQVDGLPLALVTRRAKDVFPVRRVLRKLPELTGRSEGSATVGEHDRANKTFAENS